MAMVTIASAASSLGALPSFLNFPVTAAGWPRHNYNVCADHTLRPAASLQVRLHQRCQASLRPAPAHDPGEYFCDHLDVLELIGAIAARRTN
jgi:hypothetical protein